MIVESLIKEIGTGLFMLVVTCLINEALKVFKEGVFTRNRSLAENTKEYKKLILNDMFMKSKSFLDELIRVSVVAAEQSSAGDIRKRVKEGSLDRAYLLDVATDVFNGIKEQINYETRSTLLSGINNLDTYIKTRIEENVANLKEKQKSPSSLSIPKKIEYDKVKECDEFLGTKEDGTKEDECVSEN